MPLTATEMRALYPITGRYAYLDHAAIAPVATPVRSTVEVFLGRMTEEPFNRIHWERFRSQVRGRVAELLSVGHESIAFTKNTTSGIGLVAGGLDWEDGDNIVGVDREYPANIYPWMGTALKGRDVLLVVDAIQAAGAMRLDLSATPVDFLCAGAHKWLLGPIGVGFAYVGPRMLERLTPTTIGTDSVVRDEEYFDYDLTLKADARRFEEAAPNYPGILGMGAAVNLLLRAGTAAVEDGVLRLADRLRDELPRRGYELVLKPMLPSERSGIVSFRHPRMVPAELHTRLREAGVIISLRSDFLRASPHYYNSDQDLDRLLEALPQ